MLEVCKDRQLDIDTPAFLDDQINEWVGQHEKKYPRCRQGVIVTQIRDYMGFQALRVYVESNGYDLYLLLIIGFKPQDSV